MEKIMVCVTTAHYFLRWFLFWLSFHLMQHLCIICTRTIPLVSILFFPIQFLGTNKKFIKSSFQSSFIWRTKGCSTESWTNFIAARMHNLVYFAFSTIMFLHNVLFWRLSVVVVGQCFLQHFPGVFDAHFQWLRQFIMFARCEKKAFPII